MSPAAFTAADLAGGALWALTYLLLVRRAFLDRTCGVPLPALAAAVTWELIYGVVRPTPGLPPLVVPAWLALDALIVAQYLRYGAAERGDAARAWFFVRVGAALAVAFVVQHACIVDWGDRDGVYSGFAVNVVMSLSFLARLDRRADVRGQSLYIALGKLLGTAVTIPHAYALHGELGSLRAFMAVTLAGDVAYAVLLARRCRAQGIRPWARL